MLSGAIPHGGACRYDHDRHKYGECTRRALDPGAVGRAIRCIGVHLCRAFAG